MSLDAWGWVHMIGGVVLVVAGLCVFAGQAWARAVGVLVAVASLVANFGFLGAYPILSLMMIAARRRHHLGAHRSRIRHQALTLRRLKGRSSRPHP